jgi:6-pyruvoyltetrahydropterin/6-carboxytetrahydropterin synthase
MYEIRVKEHFDAAHCIRSYVGKCSRIHGHRWEVEAAIGGTELRASNMLIDFKWVKDLLGQFVERLDHYVLNEVLEEEDVTAECLARWFYEKLAPRLPTKAVRLLRVAVWESPDCCVVYDGT